MCTIYIEISSASVAPVVIDTQIKVLHRDITPPPYSVSVRQQEDAIDASDIYKMLKDNFHPGREEDAEELLSYLLNMMNDECLKIVDNGKSLPASDNNNQGLRLSHTHTYALVVVP